MTKTAQALADEAKLLARKFSDGERRFLRHATQETAHDMNAFRDAMDAAIDTLLSLAQASQARTDGGAVIPGSLADENIGRWLSAALEDPNACAEFKADIEAWFESRMDALATLPGNATQAAGAQWQPIETAPKDGTFVLVWRDHKGGEILQARYAPTMFGDICWGGVGWSLPKSGEPTHWMPLPASPAAELKKD